jgi:type II secretory pathway pseudopilin PulG
MKGPYQMRRLAAASANVHLNRSHQGGFTMVEIAIAVAVIAFALVAIVGLLPLGMETQRNNRQETIILHDGAYLLEAIRGGATNMSDLAQYVDAVTINGATQNVANSADLIRALSRVNTTNQAIMRSFTGAAVSQSPAVKDFAMHYAAVCQIFPASGLGSIDPSTGYAGELANNLFEVRLALYWPVTPTGFIADGAHRQVFRTVLSGSVDNNGFLNSSFFVRP